MVQRKRFRLKLPSRTLVLGERTLIMGAVNVTPDSFSDGGMFLSPEAAVNHALEMEQAGADIVDIGGESTRPGSEFLPVEEEWRRLRPVLEGLKGKLRIPISVDTYKSTVAAAALEAGAEIINDVSGLRLDGQLASVAARFRAGLILMQMRGTPKTMQKKPFARNVLEDVRQGLKQSVARALAAGVRRSRIILDPGIGFGKSVEQNCELIRELEQIAALGFPVLIGTSRKSFIGKLLDDAPADRRQWGTAATVAASVLSGAHIVRVHDVREMRDVVRLADAILGRS
ncbi:MAG TPA: dihydropteroate synthase [Candidatus Acidoferrales bacterium]